MIKLDKGNDYLCVTSTYKIEAHAHFYPCTHLHHSGGVSEASECLKEKKDD